MTAFQTRWAKLRQTAISRSDFALLVIGGGLAQATPLLVTPLLTRLYSPAQMGAAALISTLIGVASAVATGRYEVPIAFIPDERQAVELLWVAGLCAVVSGALTLVIILFGGAALQDALGVDLLGGWIWLLPLGLTVQGFYQATVQWLSRKVCFRNSVVMKMVRSSVNSITNVGCGLMGLGAGGLVAGTVGGIASGAVYGIWQIRGQITSPGLQGRRGFVARTIKQFAEYPVYNATSSLLDSLSLAAPLFFLTCCFSMEAVGGYNLCLLCLGGALSPDC